MIPKSLFVANARVLDQPEEPPKEEVKPVKKDKPKKLAVPKKIKAPNDEKLTKELQNLESQKH